MGFKMMDWLNENTTTLLPFVIATLAMLPLAFLSVIKLAEKIPYRMEKDWHDTLKEQYALMQEGLDLEKYGLSIPQKISIGFFVLLIVAYFSYTLSLTPKSLAFCFFFLSLLLLSVINLKHTLFPDVIVLPLLWAGLLFHAIWETPTSEYILGAAFGYIVPFLVINVIKMKTGKQVLGFGDVKMFAMMGAWFGALALPNIFACFLLATVIGVIVPILNKKTSPLPTAYCHAFASVYTYAGWTLWGG